MVTEATDDGGRIAERLGLRLTHPDQPVMEGEAITKSALVAYYATVAGPMLAHAANRPLSLVRLPHGGHPFFQKHDAGGFPDALGRVSIEEKEGDTETYLYLRDLAGLVGAVQMNVLEFHIWGSHADGLESPDRLVFDIDPDEGLGFASVRQAALTVRARLAELGLASFPLVTGGKGMHVVAPLAPATDWPSAKAFCRGLARQLESAEPERFTTKLRKAARKDRLFIDYLRNERGATAIAPYSTRAKPDLPCAVPVSWEEVPKIERANGFDIAAAAHRAAGPDPWPGYGTVRQAITPELLAAVGGDEAD